MRKQHRRLGALAVAATILAASTAQAQQVVYEQNFDTTPAPAYTFGYAYSGYGYRDPGNPPDVPARDVGVDGAPFASFSTASSGNGVGGSNAFSLIGDFTNVRPNAIAALPANTTLNYTYQGFGLGVGVLNAPGLPSANRADYTLRFDLVYAGLNDGVADAGAEIQFALAVPDDTFVTDGNQDVDPFAVYKANVTANSTYGTYTVNFSALTPEYHGSVPTNQQDFASNIHRLLIQQFQLNIDGGPFGGDANNRVSLDNFQITAVPEPTAAALLGASLLALAPRRRRRA